MYFDWYIFKTIIALTNLFLGMRNLHDLHFRHFNSLIGAINLGFGALGLVLWARSAAQFRFWGWVAMGCCVMLELGSSAVYISINHYEFGKLRKGLKRLRG